MFKKAIPPYSIVIGGKEILIFFKLLIQGKLIRGECIESFESKFAEYIGVNFACAVPSGRLGLKLILESLGLRKGDKVIIPAYTFYVVPDVVKSAGLEPVFVEINPDDYNIDVDHIKDSITQNTRAIIATHLFGKPCGLNKILEIAQKFNLFVIEDCAQSIGAEYGGRKVGSFGDCAYFSFETVKPFHTFGGAMVSTNNKLLYEKLKSAIQTHPYPKISALLKKICFTCFESILTSYFFFTVFAYPLLFLLKLCGKDFTKIAKRAKSKFKLLQTRFTNFQAAIGGTKLKTLDTQIEKMILNAKLLNEKLTQNLNTQNRDTHTKPIFYYFVVKSSNRSKFSNLLFRKGIVGTTHLAQNCSKDSAFKDRFPVAQEMDDVVFQIPVHSDFSTKDINRLADILNKSDGF